MEEVLKISLLFLFIPGNIFLFNFILGCKLCYNERIAAFALSAKYIIAQGGNNGADKT